MSNIKNIKKSVQVSNKNHREFNLYGSIPVLIKDFFINEINLKQVLKRIEKNISQNLFQELDVVYIGNFSDLDARNVESVFMDGAIYLSNNQIDEESVYRSIVHELAHSIEKVFEQDVYGDESIISEFIFKRKQLKSILESNKFFCNSTLYLKLEFDEEFDNFLYKTVGYDNLAILTSNIFLSPYAATNLREYFSNGFEHFFSEENSEFIKKTCPKLYKKIIALTKL